MKLFPYKMQVFDTGDVQTSLSGNVFCVRLVPLNRQPKPQSPMQISDNGDVRIPLTGNFFRVRLVGPAIVMGGVREVGRGRYTQSPLGPVHPSFRAISGRLKFTVRRHKFNKDFLSLAPPS